MIDLSQLAIKKGFSVGIPCSFWRVLQLRKDRPVFETLAKVGILKPTSKMIHASSWGEPERAMQNLRFAMANIPFVCHDKNLRTWHGMSAVSKTSLDIGDHTCWQTADRLWAACSCMSVMVHSCHACVNLSHLRSRFLSRRRCALAVGWVAFHRQQAGTSSGKARVWLCNLRLTDWHSSNTCATNTNVPAPLHFLIKPAICFHH